MNSRVKQSLRPVARAVRGIVHLAFAEERKSLLETAESVRRLDKRCRNLEYELGALVRALYLNGVELPYPHALTAERFRLSSQNQEDGLTLALLKRVGTTNRRFVEIGSGSSGGNSGFLARELGWSGLMIDAGEDRVAVLRRRFNSRRVAGVAAWVTRDNVNDVLREHGFAGELDLLSIDIDGNDYWVWEALTVCSPRLLIMEYNSLFGPDRAVVVPYDSDFDRHRFGLDGKYYGASLAAFARLAEQKGYRLVATEPRGVNAYFLRHDVGSGIPASAPADAFHLQEAYAPIVSGPVGDLYRAIERAGLPLVDLDLVGTQPVAGRA